MPGVLLLLLTSALSMGLCGCGVDRKSPEIQKLPRPVTVLALKQTDPRRFTQLAGSVAAWKTEDMGFQVTGRVQRILEPGVDIEGETVDEKDRPLTEGTVIATLEKKRYEVRLASAQSQLNMAIAQSKASEVELQSVVPEQIKAAQAQVTLAQQEFDRMAKLLQREAASQSAYDQAREQLDTAKANLEQNLANQELKTAELSATKAHVDEAREAVNEAQNDLSDCELVSPYRGQIAAVYEIPGGYVNAGERVVTVQMMDPIKVEVAVSAEVDEQVNFSDIVRIYPPGSTEPTIGFVYETATIADAATRTFTVTLLVRNEKIEVGLPAGERSDSSVRIRNMWGLYIEDQQAGGPVYTNVNALHQDAEGFYVWEIVGFQRSTRPKDFEYKYKVRKVRVTPGERRIPFLQVATLRELVDTGGLDPDKDMLAGTLLDHEGTPLTKSQAEAALKDGDSVLLVRERWRLRPGDIVRVDLEGRQLSRGFYVPMDTIARIAGKSYVFVVQPGSPPTVSRVEVEVTEHESLDTFRLITAVGAEPLEEGMRIVSGGVHYLVDGEHVAVTREVEEQP